MNFLSGWKTYLVCAAAVVSALAAYSQGQLNLIDTALTILAALGGAAGRHGLDTSTQKVINATQAAVAVTSAPVVLQQIPESRDPNNLG